jgi:FkbM family methyltransferase
MTDEQFVSYLYQSMLGRVPDPEGLSMHLKLMASHGPRDVLASIVSSQEYIKRNVVVKSRCYRPSRSMTIVDVGAQNLAGESHVYTPLMQAGISCRCIGFEPLNDRRSEREGGNIEMLPHFIGDGSHQTFYINNDDSTSSLLPLNDAFNQPHNHLHGLRTVRTETVLTSRLDDVLPDVAIDFLKFDIQGFEMPALLGAEQTLKRTNVVHCEVEFAPLYKGASVFSEIERLLFRGGFYFVDFSHLCRYAYVAVPDATDVGERLGWADAVFFREKPATANDALAQAAIAELVYRKHGLAKHIMQTREFSRSC